MNLLLLILLPLLTAVLILLVKNAKQVKLIALTGSVAQFVLAFVLLFAFRNERAGGNMERTFDLLRLSELNIPIEVQKICFPLLFVGFGIFGALFPFHTWVPDGHSSAPTAGSMFLAGISMKLGGYGCLRVATYIMPDG